MQKQGNEEQGTVRFHFQDESGLAHYFITPSHKIYQQLESFIKNDNLKNTTFYVNSDIINYYDDKSGDFQKANVIQHIYINSTEELEQSETTDKNEKIIGRVITKARYKETKNNENNKENPFTILLYEDEQGLFHAVELSNELLERFYKLNKNKSSSQDNLFFIKYDIVNIYNSKVLTMERKYILREIFSY